MVMRTTTAQKNIAAKDGLDYTGLIGPVACHFWGEPNEQLSKPSELTLPLFGGVLNPRFTRPFCAVPRTSVVHTASG